MGRTLVALIAMMQLSVYFELTGALQGELQLCTSSPQPCIYWQAQPQEVCHGQNASTTMELQLPLNMIQQLTIIDIAIKRGTERLIQGLSKNPSYPYLEHWVVSHTARGAESKSSVLTVKVEVLDAQLNDEFESHVEVNVRDQIMRTPDEIWFTVKGNCSSHTTPTDVEEESTTPNLESIEEELPAASNITSGEEKLKEMTIRLHSLESTTSHGFFVLTLTIGMFCTFLVLFLVGCIFSRTPRKYFCSFKKQYHLHSACELKKYTRRSDHVDYMYGNPINGYENDQTMPAGPSDYVNNPYYTSPYSSHHSIYGFEMPAGPSDYVDSLCYASPISLHHPINGYEAVPAGPSDYADSPCYASPISSHHPINGYENDQTMSAGPSDDIDVDVYEDIHFMRT